MSQLAFNKSSQESVQQQQGPRQMASPNSDSLLTLLSVPRCACFGLVPVPLPYAAVHSRPGQACLPTTCSQMQGMGVTAENDCAAMIISMMKHCCTIAAHPCLSPLTCRHDAADFAHFTSLPDSKSTTSSCNAAAVAEGSGAA